MPSPGCSRGGSSVTVSGRPTAARAPSRALAFSSVSRSSASGSESNSSVAPARTAATPSLIWAVRRVRPVFMEPSKPMNPMAPPYQPRVVASWSSMNCMDNVMGAYVTCTAHMLVREGVQRVEPGPQPPLDVVDGVDEPRVELDLAAADDLDGAGDADARLVVAVDVGAHGQLRLLLDAGQEGADGLGVADRVGAAGDGAGDRAGLDPVAGDADEHLGRGADGGLALAEADDELVRGGVALAQPAVEGGRVVAGGVEDLAGHHLEQVAALEALLGGGHDLGVLA